MKRPIVGTTIICTVIVLTELNVCDVVSGTFRHVKTIFFSKDKILCILKTWKTSDVK